MSDITDRQMAIDEISTWDIFGVDERSRLVRWHEGLEPYVRLRDVATAISNLQSAHPKIIRCCDCIHAHDHDCPVKWGRTDDDYCSWAERGTHTL